MGTLLNIEIECAIDARCEALFSGAGEIVRAIEEKMTIYRPSEVTRLSDKAGLADYLQPVSSDTHTVVGRALEVAQQSGGLFDPTLGKHGNYQDADIRAGRVGLRRTGMLIDLGGIAKGYALDRVGASLAGHNWTLNFGGQILTHGVSRQVKVYDPRNEKSALLVCNISGGSVSTSAQNQRPGHLVNPKTRVPGAENIASIVWHPLATEADAWSTALFFADDAKFTELTDKHNIAAWQLTATSSLNISKSARKLGLCTKPSGQ